MPNEDADYFHELCDSLGFVLLAADRELRIQYCNAQGAAQFGRTPAETHGKSLPELLEEPHRHEALRLFQTTLASKAAGEIEVKFHQADGRRRTFVLIASPIVNAQGECIGVSASMRDISERKRLSQELARSRRMAALGNMAGAVTHYFNNILCGMLNSIDYALPSDSPRELRRALRLLAQEIGRATRITKQLSAFAQSESEPLEFEDLNTLMGRIVERIRVRAETLRINVVARIESVASRRFEVQRVVPVVDSLVQNAFDAMVPDGTLTISLRQEDGNAVIGIDDTGCGIPEESMEHTFEPFFTTKGELGGGPSDNIGLGLAAVHGLVSEMGGTIKLLSKVGEGTRVEVRLPLDRPIEGPMEPGLSGPTLGQGSPTQT